MEKGELAIAPMLMTCRYIQRDEELVDTLPNWNIMF